MSWSSWIWVVPAIAVVIGLAAPWVLLLTGRVWTYPEPTTILVALLGQAAVLAVMWRYLWTIGLWLVCMIRRNRECLHASGDRIWYIDPSLLSFARSDVVSARLGPQSRSTHTVEIILKGHPQPVKINARHFEGGAPAVMDFLSPEKSTMTPTSVSRPWG